MPLHSLLLCRDNGTVQFLTRGLKELGVEVESCSEPEDALRRLREQRFEAVVIDDEDRAGAALILRSLKTLASGKNSLKIVLTDSHTMLATAFASETHLVIYKPISADRLRNSLRALLNLIGRRPKRGFTRIGVKVPALLQVSERHQVSASILDISQGGVALSTPHGSPRLKSLSLKFALPGRTGMITTSAEVVWSDVRGRLGAQFVNMEPAQQTMLSEWISAQSLAKRLRKNHATRPQA
jgi:CheY-like chemotaxis protein